MSTPPKIKTEPLYRLLREGKVEVFNQEIAQGKSCDLTNCDFRGLDLRAIDADGLDFSGSYFRQADLRGVDLSKAKLQGTSIHSARIAGAYFPPELSAEEIQLSLIHGTRMRYRGA
jgi:uncharacterized protein YjbI with pentapeptide repeats